MDNVSVTAMAGVLGSLVGGSATVATTWLTQKLDDLVDERFGARTDRLR